MLFKNTSIQRKITAVIMITTLCALLLAMITLFLFEIEEFKGTLKREISSIADIVGANITASLEFDDVKSGLQILSGLKSDPRILTAEVVDASGKAFVKYENGGEVTPLIHDHMVSIQHPILLNGNKIGTIHIGATSQQLSDRLLNYAMVLFSALLIASLAAYILSAILRNLISAPIVYLAGVAHRISQTNDYTIRANKTSNDETGVLIEQFNNMLGQITKKNTELALSSIHLEESEYQLRLITDSLPVLISYIDTSTKHQFVNAEYEVWFDIKREHIKGKDLKTLWGQKTYDSMQKYVEQVLKGENISFEIQTIDCPFAKQKYISSSYIPDFNHMGQVDGFFALTSDVTMRKEQEQELKVLNSALELRVMERTLELQNSQEQLRQSERLASIGTLAAGIAHEIRNPLNTISLATQYAIKSNPNLDTSIRDVLNVVKTEALRCADIIKNVLLFAKSEKTVKTPHDITDVVQHALDIAKSYTKEKFIIEIETLKNPVQVVMNHTEVEQVIVNLISNALEAAITTPIISVKLSEEEDKVILQIGDNGPGIPLDLINHIFDPFFSTKRQKGNTGLGLSLSHGIISEHGGTMRVQSTIGQGTTFIIEFPKAKK